VSDDLQQLIEELETEQRRLELSRFDHDVAWELGSLLVRMAVEAHAPVTIDVRRPDQILFHHARPGTTADNDRWVQRKARTVFHFQESSWLVRQRFLAAGRSFEQDSGLDPRGFAAHGGSFPLAVTGAGLVGAVTVSGLPQREDHLLVTRALETFLGSSTRT